MYDRATVKNDAALFFQHSQSVPDSWMRNDRCEAVVQPATCDYI